jgi:hypothetical protein
VTLDPSSAIRGYGESFSPEKINFTNGSSSLVATVPRLPPGTLIAINTATLYTDGNILYKAFATYDQGSTQVYRTFNNNNLNANLREHTGLTDWFNAIPLPVLSGVSALALATVAGVYYWNKKRFRVPINLYNFSSNKEETQLKPKIIPDESNLEAIAGEFNEYAISLADAIENSSPRFSIGIFGGAGTGKTTMIRLIRRQISEYDNILTVWFNPWRYERERYLGVIPFLRSLKIELVNKYRNDPLAGRSRDGIWKEVEAGVERAFNAFIESIGTTVIPEENKPRQKSLGERLDPFKGDSYMRINSQTIYYYAHFSDFLSVALNKARLGRPDLRIVVFVDDLDRCTPEKAMEVLDSIKSFFTIDGIVWVIAMNINTVDELLRARYGDRSLLTGLDYVASLIQLSFQIPSWNRKSLLEAVHLYASTYIQNSDLADVIIKNAVLLTYSVTTPRFINSIIIANTVYSYHIEELIAIQALRFRPEWSRFLELITPDEIRKKFLYTYKKLKDEGITITKGEELDKLFESSPNARSLFKDEGILEIYRNLVDSGEDLRWFLDAGAFEILLHIEKIEDYERSLQNVTLKETPI